LYGRKCRSPVAWTDFRDGHLIDSEIVEETADKVIQIKERLRIARERQKKYAGHRRKPLEFNVGD